MRKLRFITIAMLLAIASITISNTYLLDPRTSKNEFGIVYGLGTPLQGVVVYADPAVSGNGSSYAITDVSGNYSMTTGLVPGSYNVSTFAEGYIMATRPFVSVTAGQTTSGIDLDLKASGGISGTVTDSVSSNPINGTELYAILSNGTSEFGWFGTTGIDGKYLIATNLVTGAYNVSIFVPPDGYIRKMTTANVIAGFETTDVNLQLDRSGILSGKVAAPNGTGLFGILVTASTSDFSYFGTTQTDVSGNYRIATGLGTGNYTVYASGDGNSTAYGGFLNPTPVLVTAGQQTTGIDMELTPVTTPPTPSGTIKGHITDQNSNPVRFATVTASGSNGLGFNNTDNNGYYIISGGLGTGNDYNVTASATGFNTAYYPTLVSVTVGQVTPNIDIQMTAKPPETFGTITGTITGEPGPIISEFQYPEVEMITVMIIGAIVSTLILRRKKNNELQS